MLGFVALALGSCGQDEEMPDSSQPDQPRHIPPNGDYKQQLLTLVNASRAAGANCGGRSMPAVGPLKYNNQLSQAAISHSKDMASKKYFSHTSPDGRSPGKRIKATGYEGYGVGENIAMGVSTAQAVYNMWMKSAGHCRGIMNKRANEMGIGYAQGGGYRYRHLWTQVFGVSKK